MKKADLITALADKRELTEKDAATIINLLFDGFTETLKKGGRIEIRGFGSFSVRDYKSFTGKNPKTGKSVEVKPKKLPFFKVWKELNRINAIDAESERLVSVDTYAEKFLFKRDRQKV